MSKNNYEMFQMFWIIASVMEVAVSVCKLTAYGGECGDGIAISTVTS